MACAREETQGSSSSGSLCRGAALRALALDDGSVSSGAAAGPERRVFEQFLEQIAVEDQHELDETAESLLGSAEDVLEISMDKSCRSDGWRSATSIWASKRSRTSPTRCGCTGCGSTLGERAT